MWYGLHYKSFIRILIIFFGIGILASVFGIIIVQFEKPENINYLGLLPLIFGIPAIWLILASFLSITWLKVDDQQVEWYLWKKIHLLSCPIADITDVGTGFVSAFLIKTKKGTIRLFALYWKDREKLSEYFIKMNPNIKKLNA